MTKQIQNEIQLFNKSLMLDLTFQPCVYIPWMRLPSDFWSNIGKYWWICWGFNFIDFHAFLMKYQSEIDKNIKKGGAVAPSRGRRGLGPGWPGLADGATGPHFWYFYWFLIDISSKMYENQWNWNLNKSINIYQYRIIKSLGSHIHNH